MFELNITKETNDFGDLIFEIEKDLNYNTIITRLYYKNETPKQIMLAEVLSLA